MNRVESPGASSADAVVVGAGPVGLALAIGLRRHGLSVRILDRAPGPKTEPRAAVIWPRGAEVLDDLGVGETVRQAANELGTVHFHARGRRLGGARLGGLDSAYPRPLLIEQHVTERILAARLQALGVSVEWNVEAADIRLGPQGGTVEARSRFDGRTILVRGGWIVGCDGARSCVRERLGVSFEGRPVLNLQIMQVDAVPRWRHARAEDVGYYFLAPQACLGCFPIAQGAYRFFCYTDDPAPERKEPPSLAEMQALIARVAGAPELRLERPTWLNRARFQTRRAARLRVGRALLAGDAAHVWPSLGGHGMNIGLRGAHNLAWKLAAVHQGGAGEALLDTYEAEERKTVDSFLRLMRFNFVEQPSSRLGLLARATTLRAGLGLSGLSRRFERAVSDLDAHHRRSVLSGSSRPRPPALSGLRAGDRLPDLTVRTPEGGPARLHDLLGYEHWTLIASDALPSPRLDELRALLLPRQGGVRLVRIGANEDEPLGGALGAGALVLVRPDRHIGLIVDGSDLPDLRRYLDRWCPASPSGRRQTDGDPDRGGLLLCGRLDPVA